MEEEVISKIKFDETFIESLLKLLKVGNRRGIHLNAIPGSARSRLDLKDLNSLKDNSDQEFLSTIFSDPEFSFNINFDGLNISDLDEDEKNKLK